MAVYMYLFGMVKVHGCIPVIIGYG